MIRQNAKSTHINDGFIIVDIRIAFVRKICDQSGFSASSRRYKNERGTVFFYCSGVKWHNIRLENSILIDNILQRLDRSSRDNFSALKGNHIGLCRTYNLNVNIFFWWFLLFWNALTRIQTEKVIHFWRYITIVNDTKPFLRVWLRQIDFFHELSEKATVTLIIFRGSSSNYV